MNIYRTNDNFKQQSAEIAADKIAEISDIKKHFSLLHPYKDPARALHLISPITDMARAVEGVSLDEALAKIDPALFRDRKFALKAIETTQAFLYVDKQLRNDISFVKEAIRNNPKIFDLLDPSIARQPEIKECYAQAFISHPYFHFIERGDSASLSATMIPSNKIDPHDIFNVEKYQHAFSEALKRPFEKDFRMDDHLSKHVAFIVAAQTLCPDLESQYRAAEKEVFLNNPALIESVILNGYAKHHLEARSLMETLEEVFADSPALMDKFEDLKRQSWEMQAQRVLQIHDALMEHDGRSLDKYQITLALTYFDEMKQYVPLTQELKYALQLEKDPRWDRTYDPDGLQYECDMNELARR